MEKQRDRQVDDFVKKKEKAANEAQLHRIRQREQEMFQKKHLMIMKKEEMQMDRAVKMEQAKSKLANKYADKVQSKLLVETKAM